MRFRSSRPLTSWVIALLAVLVEIGAVDAGPAELARALGETSIDPAYLARLWDAYRAGIVGRAPVLAEAGA